jgi:hypothetical protein
MPYIHEMERLWINRGGSAVNEGELNYVITHAIDAYIAHRGLKYETLNAIVGALECAKLELYRRVAAPYEDTKIDSNGDVYTTRTDRT